MNWPALPAMGMLFWITAAISKMAGSIAAMERSLQIGSKHFCLLENGFMNEKGFSLVEMIIVVAILGIIVAIGIPNLYRAKQAARESSAVKYLRTWSAGQETYKKANGCYATSDEALVTGGFVEGRAVIGGVADDAGYYYSIGSNGCAEPNPNTWYGRANRKDTISSSYYIDQSGVIHRAIAATANASDPPL